MNVSFAVQEEKVSHIVDKISSVGFCVVENILAPTTSRKLRRVLQALLEAEKAKNLRPSGHQRVIHLAIKHPAFLDLACHPLVLAVWRKYLGSDMICSSLTANALWPGSTEQYWHVDHPYWTITPPYPVDVPLGGQAIWMIDDFTKDNGATAGVPRSHHRTYPPEIGNGWSNDATLFTGKAGSVAFLDGALWHTSTVNTTSAIRRAVLIRFIRSYCVQQEDMRLQLTKLQAPSDIVQELFGATQYTPTRDFPY
ncbi:phytanoyl-CoA dioxygenase family protein (plasmid) [Mycetohabitans endofungorum]|uniref:phytanoyl-CoA dioxygenase family protein n=1 Tax=Mycetohabitans endofungorum TaxID=417203 RepID=UPI0030CF5511